ncbi:hypothetical protein GmHk_18G052449 [Glycine max]|nr:hypothetical protein GmHk_18G052449 [Glycine max]
MASEEPIIRDNISNFGDDKQQYDPTFRNQEYSNSYQNKGSASTNDLYEGLTFESKQEVVDAIKQFHFMHSFNFDVVKNKSDKYVIMCNQYGNGCYWRARVSFSKIHKSWELKKINGIHTCTTFVISQDHVRLDSRIIAHNIVHLVKTNPGIEIKTLIADMLQQFVENNHSYLPVWLIAAQHFVSGTIVRYKTSSSMEDGEDESPRYFVDCHWTSGSRKNFPLAFAIVESKIKEAWMWFLHYLKRYVTPQPNLCIISYRGTNLLAALQSERVGLNGPDVSYVYCIRHIASNFNKQFKNIDLKKQVINMGYKMRKPRFEAKLIAMRAEFPQAAY